MARHITAKKQLTRDRALALIDQDIDTYERVATEMASLGHDQHYTETAIKVLWDLRARVEWACEVGVFPPSK